MARLIWQLNNYQQMKIYFKNIAYLFAASSMLFTACGDIDPLVDGLENTARVFSPTDVEVRVFNSVNARIYWDDVKNAERYNVAFFLDSLGQDLAGLDFDSESFVRADYNIGSTSSIDPYIAYGLPQDQGLTVYVQAISLIEGTANSKWTPYYFETSSENIISDIETTSSLIRVSWEAGAAVTSIVLKNETTAEETTYELTTSEISAGKASIAAAAGTAYLVSIYNGNSVRGEAVATTKPDGTLLAAGADIAAAVAAAADGDVILLSGGVYTYDVETNIKIDKSITIVNADDASRPKLTGILFTLNATDINVTLQGLDLDGLGGGESHTIIVGDVAKMGDVSVEDCSFANYQKGVFYGAYSVEIASVTFHNNVFTNFACNGADFIDIRKSYTPILTITHNTINTVGYASKRQIVRYDGNIGGSRNTFDGTGAADGSLTEINLSNNTLYYAPGNELLYLTFSGATVSAMANLFVTPEDDRGRWGGRGTVNDEIPLECAKNYYFGTKGMYDSTSGILSDFYDTKGVVLNENPYKRPARGDFSVNADLSGKKIGASRWWVNN